MTDFGNFLINNMRSNLEPSELVQLKSASQYHLAREANTAAASAATAASTKAPDLQPCILFRTIKEEEEELKSLSVNSTTQSSTSNSSSSTHEEEDTSQESIHPVAQLVDDNNYLVARDTSCIRAQAPIIPIIPIIPVIQTPHVTAVHRPFSVKRPDQFVLMNPIYETEFERSDYNLQSQESSDQQQLAPTIVKPIVNKTEHGNTVTTNVYEEYMDQVNFVCPATKVEARKLNFVTQAKKPELRDTPSATFSFVKMLRTFRTIFGNHVGTDSAKHTFFNGLSGQTNKISPSHSNTTSGLSNQSTQSIVDALAVLKDKKNKHIQHSKSSKKGKRSGGIYSPAGRKPINVNRNQSRRLNMNMKLKQRQKSMKLLDSKVNKIQQKLAASNHALANLNAKNKPAEKSKEKLLVNWDKILKKANTKNPESFKRLIQTNLKGVNLQQQIGSVVGSKLVGLDNKFKTNKTDISANGLNDKTVNDKTLTVRSNKNVNFQLSKPSGPKQVELKPVPKDLNENFRKSLLTILGSDGVKEPVKHLPLKKFSIKDQKSQKEMLQKQKKISKIVHKMPLHSISAMLNAEMTGCKDPPASISSWTTSSTVVKSEEICAEAVVQSPKSKKEVKISTAVSEALVPVRKIPPKIHVDEPPKKSEHVAATEKIEAQENTARNSNMTMFYFRPGSPRTLMKNRTQKFIKNVCNHLNQTLGRSLVAKTQQAALDELKTADLAVGATATTVAKVDKETLRLLEMQNSIFKTLFKSKHFHNLVPGVEAGEAATVKAKKKSGEGVKITVAEVVEYSNNLTTGRIKKDMNKLHRTLNKKLQFYNKRQVVAEGKHTVTKKQFVSEYTDINEIYYNNNIKAKAL